MKFALVLSVFLATTAHAQLTTIGAAPSPSPSLSGVITAPPGVLPAQCVIATPIPGTQNAVLLSPCPPLSPSPPVVMPPIAETPPPCPPVSGQLPAPVPTPSAQSRSAPKKMCPC